MSMIVHIYSIIMWHFKGVEFFPTHSNGVVFTANVSNSQLMVRKGMENSLVSTATPTLKPLRPVKSLAVNVAPASAAAPLELDDIAEAFSRIDANVVMSVGYGRPIASMDGYQGQKNIG